MRVSTVLILPPLCLFECICVTTPYYFVGVVFYRYTVKVTEDHMASLQLGTSKPDVYIKLQVRHVSE